MQVTVNVPDDFAKVAKEKGWANAESFLAALASQEIIRHFNEQKGNNPQKQLLHG